MLAVTDLVVTLGDAEVLHGVDLAVDGGEVVCVLGPSGSGKSTLLRAIAGLEPVDAGTITWDGADLAGVPPHRRGMGLMFQDDALFPHRDVLANVAYGPRAHGASRAEADGRARALLDVVGLAGLEHRAVRDLSGGERRRVALARALAPEPRLLMLDEPLGGLDRTLHDRLVRELADLFSRRERAVLVVTHDHEEAFALADRIVVVHDGRVHQDADPAVLWRAPATAFVATFLGFGVTRAFGPLLAVPSDGLTLEPAGAGSVTGRVTGHVLRRAGLGVRVVLPDGAEVEVTVDPAASAELAVGAEVALTLRAGAGIPLPGP